MSDFSIGFTRSARKELEALPNQLIQRIFHKIESLATNPRPTGCAKLKGAADLWRIRIGDYRVIYSIEDRLIQIEIIAVRHRSEVYD